MSVRRREDRSLLSIKPFGDSSDLKAEGKTGLGDGKTISRGKMVKPVPQSCDRSGTVLMSNA
jgi:hypothetical protein